MKSNWMKKGIVFCTDGHLLKLTEMKKRMLPCELRQDDFGRVLPLYSAGGDCYPLILAVIRRKQRGQVFADDAKNPRSAFVVGKSGFAALVGDGENRRFHAALEELLSARGLAELDYLLWYDPPHWWQEKLEALTPQPVRRRERTRLRFCAECADYLDEEIEIPAGFQLGTLDTKWIPKADKLGLDIGSKFWRSEADFCEHGLGVCLAIDGEVVSLCYSACVVDGLAEIDIFTRPEHRRKGLGGVVSQKFVKECMRRDITPTWDCFVANAASNRLAEELGFIPDKHYHFYSFNVPLGLSSR